MDYLEHSYHDYHDYNALPGFVVLIAIGLVATLLAAIPAGIANARGREPTVWFIYGLLLFPVALVHSACLWPTRQARDAQARAAGDKQCPECAEFVRSRARVCQWCGADVTEAHAPVRKTPLTDWLDPNRPIGAPAPPAERAPGPDPPRRRPRPLNFSDD